MDTALKNGDFAKNSSGKIYSINAMEETLQRCKILLTVRQKSFVYNPQLGHRLHLLRTDDERLQGNALVLVQEALYSVPQVTVENVTAKVENNVIRLLVNISAYNQTEVLEVNINNEEL